MILMNTNTDNTQGKNKKSEGAPIFKKRGIEAEGPIKNERSEESKPTEPGQYETVGGVICPIDPMERLQCESCQ